MARLAGLQGMNAPAPPQYMDEGVLESKANDLNPEHGSYGSQSDGYSGTIPTESPYSPMQVYDGYDSTAAPQYGPPVGMNVYGLSTGGEADDQTPTTHSSPFPRTGLSTMQSWSNPDGAALVGDQMQDLHGPDLGGVQFYQFTAPAGREEPTNYTTERYDAPNENYLSPDVPGQLRGAGSNGVGASGHGNADTTQGYGVLNTLPEFQMGHSIRREQHDTVHFDFTNTHGEQDVPFLGRHPQDQHNFDGPDSPYFEQGNISGNQIPWEARIGDPTQYQQPPEVTISSAPLSQSDYYPSLSF